MKANIHIKKISSYIALALIAAMALGGCSNKNDMAGKGGSGEKFHFEGYPINSNATISVWSSFSRGNSVETNYSKTEFAKQLEKATGIKATYRHAPVGQEAEALNILVASGEMPDIIEYSWPDYPGGIDKAINEGIIISLNDILPEYAPNLYNYLKNDPDADRYCKSHDGNYYAFPLIREKDLSYRGPMVRKDWLDELGLPIPETIDDWYTMLKAFKEKKGISTPLTLPIQLINQGAFLGAYGVKNDFYIDDNHKVKYGPLEQGFKEGLETLNKWYAEGLLDKNFATLNPQEWDANILTEKSGATVGNKGGHLDKWMTAMKDENPDFYLYAVPYPTLKKGETPKFGQTEYKVNTTISMAITAACKNPELVASYIDFGYTEEGSKLFNYGTEGVSYIMKDGKPEYTEEIYNNPKGWSVNNALSYYTQADMGGSFFLKDAQDALPVDETKKDTNTEVWANTDDMKYRFPKAEMSSEANAEYSNIMGDLETYVSESVIKFIIGVKPLSEYDSFVNQIKSMNIDRAIELKQQAVDNYFSN